MIGPVRVFLVLRESPQLDSLAAIAAVSALFAATPFIIPAVALEYSVSLGRSGLLSAAQVGGFAVAVFVAGRRLRTHRAYLNGEIFYTLPGPSSSSSSGGWSHSLSGTDSFVRYTGFLDEPSCAHSYSMVA